MIRDTITERLVQMRLPRMRGDDPYFNVSDNGTAQFAPHARG